MVSEIQININTVQSEYQVANNYESSGAANRCSLG